MPVKLYYNGSATLYGFPSPCCLKALEKSREKKKRIKELAAWDSLDPESDKYRQLINNDDSKELRHYRLKHHNRQQIISSGIYGHDKKENNVLFLTLTYPATKFTHDDPEKSSNQALKKFLNNLRTNYELNGYAWVKELTKIGTPHYHLLADLPYIDIQKLNDIWANNAKIVSRCCVRHDPDNGLIVKTPEQAGFYVAKYISKMKSNCQFNKRVYTISNSWQVKPLTIDDDEQIKMIISNSTNTFEGEHTTTLNIGHNLSRQIYDTLT